jgi:hypothetical protein
MKQAHEENKDVRIQEEQEALKNQVEQQEDEEDLFDFFPRLNVSLVK